MIAGSLGLPHTAFDLLGIDYCGRDAPVISAGPPVLAAPWDPRAVLAGVTRDTLTIDPDFVRELEPILWNDLCSEYDAENFCRYLDDRERAGTLRRTPEFRAFEAAWRKDELNHTIGYATLYALLYEATVPAVLDRLRARPVDFAPIAHLLADEFRMCVALAYDEIATTRSYKDDLDTRYPRFANPALLDWIRRVTRDEGFHFANIIRVIKKNHAHRARELPAVLDELVAWDSTGGEYQGTFVLDHEGGQFTPGFLAECRRLILRQFTEVSR
jgi:hypothetical protein